MRPDLYLASRSPRRQELLRQVGVRFELVDAEVEERRLPGQSPADYAVATALAKARAGSRVATTEWRRLNGNDSAPAGAAKVGGSVPVLGADTDVVIDGEILGKPAGRDDAVAMLLRLAGREHDVFSAVAIVGEKSTESALSVTRVSFGPISQAEALAYWNTGEPDGKAGAYAIQGLGARFVKSIEGSYSGVVGLPLYETCDLLRRFGIFSC